MRDTETESKLALMFEIAATVNEFRKTYSWDTWFKSLTVKQLQSTRETWYRAFLRSKGHERNIMMWDIAQIDAAITRREAGE